MILLTVYLLCAQPCICRTSYFPPDWQAVAEMHHSYSVYEGQREPKRWWWTLPLRHHREKK